MSNFGGRSNVSASEFQRPVFSYVKENVKYRYSIMVPKLLHISKLFLWQEHPKHMFKLIDKEKNNNLMLLTYVHAYIGNWLYLNQCMRVPTMCNARPAKPQISLRIGAV